MISTKDFPPETLSALVDASAAINSAQALDATLSAIARAAAAVMKAEASSVIMLDKVRGKQVFCAAVGDRADQIIGLEYEQSAGISGRAIQSGQAVVVHDVSKDRSHYKDIDARVAFTTRSLIAAPLVHKGQKLGVVEVLNPVQAERFNDNDVELCRIFANLAAIAAANSQAHDRLQRENRGLKQVMQPARDMIGASPAMTQVKELIRRVARSSATVLLLGETGTGKELAARMTHAESDRSDGPFIAVNCAALPETLLESELLGMRPGRSPAQSGASSGGSSSRAAAPYSSTKSPRSPRAYRSSCCACSRRKRSSAWAARPPSASTCGSSPPRTATCPRRSRPAGSARTSTTA